MTTDSMTNAELLIIQAQCAKSEEERRALFNELVHKHQEMAHSYSYALLGDLQLAEDVTQEAFLTAYQLLSQLREPRAFAGWLRRIVHSHCHRLLRQGKLSTQSLDLSTDLIAPQPSPQAFLEHLELQEIVQAKIKSLPKSQQAPVELYYLGNYSQHEIAAMLNLSLPAVKKRLERARDQLQERMREMAQEYLHSTPQAGGISIDLFTTLMDAAAEEGQYILLETLFVEGVDVDALDADGQTMLHWAAKAGHLEAVELLLDCHADPMRRDHAGRTALQLALSGGHQRVAERLRHPARQK
jgi:RNA polymerase sigma factor (sigma-70 family)